MAEPTQSKARSKILTAVAWVWALVAGIGIAVHVPGVISASHLFYAGLTRTDLRTPWVPKEVAGRRVTPFPVRDAGAVSRTLDLTSGTSLVFVYDRSCSVCHKNMARWVELLLAARRGGVPVYALSRGDATAQHTYWGGFERSVETYSPTDSALLTTAFGVTGTPCTVLVRDGVVTGVFQGVVDPSRFKWLVQRLQSNSPI